MCAVMAPALLRLLERFDLRFERLGPLIHYHGERQPCIAEAEALLDGLARYHGEYHQAIEAEYRQRSARRLSAEQQQRVPGAHGRVTRGAGPRVDP
jgi:hypothetical protein